ncbi:MAG: hypothetical protein ABWY12_02410, partial [Burkholderiales bacterium]
MRLVVLLCAAAMPVDAVPAFAETPAPDAAVIDPATTDASDGLPEVIVTARRRAEDAQTVPAALSVVGGALIDQSFTVNTQGLTTLIPSL